MKIKNILIDLDGTIADPKVGITTSIQYVFERLNLPIPNTEELLWCIGPSIVESMTKLLPVGYDVNQAVSIYRERYKEKGLFENDLYPGISNMLKVLKKAKLNLFVATAKPTIFAIPILQNLKLDHFFEGIHGSELNGKFNNKADLVSFITFQYRLNKFETVMIGDRVYDIQAACENEIACIAARWGYGSDREFTNAKWQANHPNEIINILGLG
jgi:phosphoglycolate phosphatase